MQAGPVFNNRKKHLPNPDAGSQPSEGALERFLFQLEPRRTPCGRRGESLIAQVMSICRGILARGGVAFFSRENNEGLSSTFLRGNSRP